MRWINRGYPGRKRSRPRVRRCLSALGLVLPLGLISARCEALQVAPAAKVDFNREVRPILAKNCFACHGQDEAKTGQGAAPGPPRVGRQAAQERRHRRSSPAIPNPAS